MSDSVKAALLRAAARILEPLVRLLLEAGIGVGELHAVIKGVYVKVARGDRPEVRPNASRIAVLTGMTRADVTAYIRSDEEKVDPGAWDRSRAERVLTGWWSDEKYQDRTGTPLVLRLRGPKSFTSLVKAYAGEPRTLSILEELLRAHAVRQPADGKIEVLSRTLANLRWDASGIEGLGEHARRYIDTLAHNLKHPSQPRFATVVMNAQIDPYYAPIIARDATRQAQTFARSIERTINKPTATLRPTSRAQDALRLSISIAVSEESVVIESRPRKRADPSSDK